ncbi:diphthamide biosynthesis enzyme Dph2 [Candidatus Woesearchaeota archaeon]|nr:diphthamide biosynthesis enzyme Dph2 [Candidatus Woesearchaeota archaeon]
MYDFEESRLLKELKQRKPKRVLLQVPEGLKKEAVRLAELMRKKAKTEVVVSGEPLWGACDIAINEAKMVKANLIVIYGHAPFYKPSFPVIYVEAHYLKNIDPLLKKVLPQLKELKKIGLIASVQHLHQLPKVKEVLEKAGKKVVIPMKKGHAFYDGQVLGCEYNAVKIVAKDVDGFLILGNKFHALGAALAVNKPIILLDPYNEEIADMDSLRNKIIRQRFAAIEKAKEAKVFGIIMGLKEGQQFGSVEYAVEKLKKLGKQYVIITMNEITSDKLINFYNVDVFVEMACPRIAIEDVAKFAKPLLTAREFAIVVGDGKWEDLLERGFL